MIKYWQKHAEVPKEEKRKLTWLMKFYNFSPNFSLHCTKFGSIKYDISAIIFKFPQG